MLRCWLAPSGFGFVGMRVVNCQNSATDSRGFEASSPEPSSPLWTTDGSFGHPQPVGKWKKTFQNSRKSRLQNIEFLSSHDAHTHHHVWDEYPKSSGSETSPSFEYLFYVPQSRWENLSSSELTKMGEKSIVDYGLLHIHRDFLINPQGIIQLSINQSMAAWLPDLLLNFGKVQGLKGWGNSAAAFLWFLSLNTWGGMRWRSCKRWQRRHWKRWRVESFW